MKYDINSLRNDLSLYKYPTQVSLTDLAYYSGHQTQDDDSSYGFIDWMKDAKAAFNIGVQEGEMQEAQDVMASSRINEDDADYLLKYFYGEGSDYDQLDSQKAEAAIQSLINNGVIQNSDEISAQRLQEIIDESQKDYNEQKEILLRNQQQLQEQLRSHDISQYYTRRSNEATLNWGNWFYKLPATMGTSFTSPLAMLGSIGFGILGTITGQHIGAFVGGLAAGISGTTVAPGPGTVAGGVTGAGIGSAIGGTLFGMIGSQFGGGMQARQYESHMEAFNSYYEQVIDAAKRENVDIAKIANNVKDQLQQKGEDTTGLTEDLLIQRLISDKDLVSGSATFDRIAQDEFKGTRRVYEKNNAYGVGEMVTDALSMIPFMKIGRQGWKAVGRATSRAIGKATSKIGAGKVLNGLSKRFNTGVDVAVAASKARNRKKFADMMKFLGLLGAQAVQEGTEEGGQYIIQKEALEGKYDNEVANDSWYDAVMDGQIFEDMVDNTFSRARAFGAFFNLDPEYKDDDEMYENMLVGALMPFVSPNGVVQTAGAAVHFRNNWMDSNKAKEYMSAALSQQDYIGRLKESYDIIRGRQVSDENMFDFLNRMRDELKKKDKDGKVRKYNLDTAAITEDGSIPTDEDIDKFFDAQMQEYQKIAANKVAAKNDLKQLNLSNDDESLYLALRLNAEDELKQSKEELEKLQVDADRIDEQIHKSDGYLDALRQLGLEDAYNSLNDQQKQEFFVLNQLNSQLKSIERRNDAIHNQTGIIDELLDRGYIKEKNLKDAAETIIAFDTIYASLRGIRDGLANRMQESGVSEDVMNKLKNVTVTTTDSELFAKNQKANDNLVNARALYSLLNSKSKLLRVNDKSKAASIEAIKNQLNEYKNSRRRQEKLADQDNEAARTGVQPNETKETSTDKILDLSKEEIAQRQQAIDEQVRTQVDTLKQLVDSIPDDSNLSDVRDKIRNIVGDIEDPFEYARFASNVLKNLKYKYQDANIGTDISKEDKERYDQLYQLSDHLQNQLDKALRYIAEQKARAERKPIKFSTDSSVYSDEHGNRYQLRMNKSEYSEDEGLLLHLKPLMSEESENELKNLVDRLQKTKEKIQNRPAENDEERQRNENMIKSINDIISRLNESKDSKEIIVKATDPYLSTFTTTDNEGNTKTLDSKLRKWNATTQDAISGDRRKRKLQDMKSTVTEDVKELSDNTTTDVKMSLESQIALQSVKTDGTPRIKAYPLKTPNGLRSASMLSNAYYREEYWHGKILMPYLNEEDAQRVLGEKSEVTFNGKEWNRLRAVRLFHKFGGQMHYLRTHNKLGDKLKQDFQKMLDGEITEMKIGSAKFTIDDLDYMVYVLPLRKHLRNYRAGEQIAMVHLPDLGSENRDTDMKLGDAEYNSRAQLIINLLASYKKLDAKDEVRSDQYEGLTEEQEEAASSNGVTVRNGMVHFVFGGFDHDTRTVVDDDAFIFRNADGKAMTEAQRNQHYEDRATESIDKITNNIDRLVNLAHSIGLVNASREMLEQIPKSKDANSEKKSISNLLKLVIQAGKYGDGIITRDTFYNTVKATLGLAEDTKKVKEAANARARIILRFFQNEIPELFISYKNFQDDNNLTPSVEISVEEALQNRYFTKSRKSIRIFKDGQPINVTDNEENRKNITAMMKQFEKLVRESSSANEFIDSLNSLGYTFQIQNSNLDETDRQNQAEEILRDYFTNRRFSRLPIPNNIVQALTLGTATPLNKYIDEEQFGRRVIHNHNKISDVKSLHLKKDKNGVYYFSLTDFAKQTAENERLESINKAKTELNQRIEEEYNKFNSLKEELSSISNRDKSGLIDWIQDHAKTFIQEDLNEILRTVTKGQNKGSVTLKYSVRETKDKIKDLFDYYSQEAGDTLKADYETFIEEQIKRESENQLRSVPLQFAYGSYEKKESGAAIVYYDENHNKHEAQAVGSAGAIYLDMPSFLFSDGKRKLYHLNPARFDLNMATFIAEMFKMVADGRNLESFADGITTPSGYTVKSSTFVGTLLNQLLYYGRDAIINNASAENYARLLYVDNEGKVKFGPNSEVLTNDNFDKFVNFILENKTYRIDRDKITNSTAMFDYDITITDPNGKVIFQRNRLDNYIAKVVDDGLLTCDLSTRGASRIVTQPNVYSDYVTTWNFSHAANATEQEGSAANNKKKLKDDFEAASKEEIVEDIIKSQEKSTKKSGKKGTLSISNEEAAEQTSKFVAKLEDYVSKLRGDGKIKGDSVTLTNVTKLKGNKTNTEEYTTVTAGFQAIVDKDGNTVSSLDYNGSAAKFKARIIHGIKNGKEPIIKITDSEGNEFSYKWDMSKFFSQYESSDNNQTAASASSSGTTQIIIQVQSSGELIPVLNAFGVSAPQVSSTQTQVPVADQSETTQKVHLPQFAKSVLDINANKPSDETKTASSQVEDDQVVDVLTPKLTVNGDNYTIQYQGDTYTGKLSENNNSEIISDLDPDGDLLSDDKVKNLEQQLNSARNQTSQPKQGTTTQQSRPGAVSPASRFLANVQSETTSKEPNIPTDVKFANNSQLDSFVDREIKSDLKDKYKNKTLSENEYLSLHSKYIQSTFNKSREESTAAVALSRELRARYRQYTDPSANTGNILNFLNENVQKEEFEPALNRAKQILGNDFDLSFLHDTPKVYDKSRDAMIYVFGQCAASGIRLFRDADGRIAKGSLYHEAFHKISLFILSSEERSQMYTDALVQYQELNGKQGMEIEEFLADRFAEFVLDASQRKQGKYYSSNPVFKFFQKIFDKIRQILNKMSNHNITPKYVNLDKLFKDMYSGRYAYAKATSNNIEEFNKIYSGYTPYKGYKVGDVVLAEDSVQYSKIYRDLLGKLVRLANIQYSNDGRVEINTDTLKEELQSDLNFYRTSLAELINSKDKILSSSKKQQFTANDVDAACIQMYRFIEVMNNVLKDDNWNTWESILKNDLNRRFNLERDAENSPNQILNNNTYIDDNGDEVPVNVNVNNQFADYNMPSYMKNLYDSSSIDMKLLLWSITQYDGSNPETAKFTPDGIIEYVNVQDLFRRICDVITNSKDVSDMLKRLREVGEKDAKNVGDYSIIQLYQILSDEKVNPNLAKSFFTNFVRHIQTFVNYNYTTVENKAGNGTTISYDAQVRNNNLDNIASNLKYQWRSGLLIKLGSLGSLDNKSRQAEIKKVSDALTAMNRNKNRQTIKNLLDKLQQVFGIGSVTGDLDKDAYIFEQMLKTSERGRKIGSDNILTSLVKKLKDIKSYSADSSNKKDPVKELFGEKGDLTALIQKLEDKVPNTAKNTSQRGAKGVKIYPIGAYNFITNLFERSIKDEQWAKMMRENPYSMHSQWLEPLLQNADNITFSTILSTVLDDDYQDSTADIDITPTNDLINKFIAVMDGYHVMPSLANKKFAGLLSGVPQLDAVMDVDGNINPYIIDVFVGYLADEIVAISDAYYLRDKFLERLSQATGENWTVDKLSNLSSLEQERLFKNEKVNVLLKMLKKTYHYSNITPQVLNLTGKHTAIRTFGIDLRKGSGYKFRHFKNIMKDFTFDKGDIEIISKESLSGYDRSVGRIRAEQIANQYRSAIRRMLEGNIAATVNKFIQEDIIEGNYANVENGSVDILSLRNNFLPKDAITRFLQKTKSDAKIVDYSSNASSTSDNHGKQIYRAIGFYTIQAMSDTVEFEKIVSGDIGFHKDITSVNKRYSGLTSTFQLNDSYGSIKSQLVEDRLYDSPTYNVVEVNTSKVVNKGKFAGDIYNSIGLDLNIEYIEETDSKGNSTGSVKPVIDYHQLLDDEGNLKPTVKISPLGRRFLKDRKYGRKYGLKDNGEPKSDAELAQDIVKTAIKDFTGYLNNDPTDAGVFITMEMFRQLRQRIGQWNDVDEACYNLMRFYRDIDQFSQDSIRQICDTLGISYKELIQKYNKYLVQKARGENLSNKNITDYRNFIIDATKSLDLTSLKYIYYGNSQGREDKLVDPIYDKMSLIVLCELLTEGHEVDAIYQSLKDRKIDCMKFESATKSGGVPCFELFDVNGRFDPTSIQYSIVQNQNFSQLNKQLNTDPHHTTKADLLTQFMKISMMNIEPDQQYFIGDRQFSGKQLTDAYKAILDELTSRGYKKFKDEFGITEYGIDKDKFMAKMREIASTQELPESTLSAFSITSDDYTIHPAVIPNIRFMQSRIIAQMGSSVIKVTTPGQPLYQQPSLGYDNIFDIEAHPDKHLLMPGELNSDGSINRRMQVKLSVTFFDDIIKQAQKLQKDGKLKGYDMNKFSDQRRFILNNKDLIALSYRVPTQGQNSTIPVEIVDVYPPQKGGVIQFPAGVTAQTGSDFDIDKMFLARYNYTIVNNKLQKITYKLPSDLNDFYKVVSNMDTRELQNMLLDMYQTVLTSNHHYLEANVPIDVCTEPLKKMAQERIQSDSEAEGNLESNLDGYYLNPVFQTAQKEKNAGSDGGIGPMALNSVFRFFIQVSGLKFLPNEILEKYGLQDINRMFDKYGEDILDVTSALINAHVDAVKDNYIGKVNVNGYTYNVTSLMVTTGFGNDTFAFLSQPVIKQVAKNWAKYKQGKIGVYESDRIGTEYLSTIQNEVIDRVRSFGKRFEIGAVADSSDMEMGTLIDRANNQKETFDYWYSQLKYLNTFLRLRDIANEYSNGIQCVQIDTERYGINADEIIAFDQKVDKFTSPYNVTFENPRSLFDNTFLGEKYTQGVQGLFEAFNGVLFEFSHFYKDIADQLSNEYGVYGYSKEFLKRVGPRIKAVAMLPFFNQYLINRFGDKYPLQHLVMGADSIFARYQKIKDKCLLTGEGIELFNNVRYNGVFNIKQPQFFMVDNKVKNDIYLKGNVQAAIEELFESNDPEVRKWAEDFIVYMFYVTAGSDSNAGGMVKTSVYDLIPPQCLANITSNFGNGGITLNQYMENIMNSNTFDFQESEKDMVMMLTGLSDDSIIPVLQNGKRTRIQQLLKDKVIAIGFGSRAISTPSGGFKKIIKVKGDKENISFYKLGNAYFNRSKKDGKYYLNPIYYKVSKLGYRLNTNAAYSLRADGFVDDNGVIRSLLNTNSDFTATSFNDLAENQQKTIRKSLGLSESEPVLDVAGDKIDYSQALHPMYANEIFDRLPYVMIDQADTVYYINTGIASQDYRLLEYTRQSQSKEFYVVSSTNQEMPNARGGKITIIGRDVNPVVIQKIIEANPGKQIITFDNSNMSQQLIPLIQEEVINNNPDNLIILNDFGTTQNTTETKVTRIGSKVHRSVELYNRGKVSRDTKSLYIFTDNWDRTSGGERYDENSWYNQKYGENGGYGSTNNPTTAVIRGLDNVAPISTMKAYWRNHSDMKTYKDARLQDSDFNEFKRILDDEIKQIKQMWDTGKYDKLVIPNSDFLFNSSISEITKSRTPRIHDYMNQKIQELYEYVDGNNNTIDKSSINRSYIPNIQVKGENISSKGSEFAKKLTNYGNDVQVEYKGRVYRNSEHAYQTWKSGEFDSVAYNSKAAKPRGSKRVNTYVNYDIMVDIITNKLEQHPDLIKGIIERGGIDYILNSTHRVIGDKYWESSGQNKFIEALADAARNVGIKEGMSREELEGLINKINCKS